MSSWLLERYCVVFNGVKTFDLIVNILSDQQNILYELCDMTNDEASNNKASLLFIRFD